MENERIALSLMQTQERGVTNPTASVSIDQAIEKTRQVMNVDANVNVRIKAKKQHGLR